MEKDPQTCSVVVPVYNVSEYLDRCLKTILSQTMPFDEIILVDDGSTDGSGAMCDGYAKRFSRVKVVHKANGGLSSARNAGIAVSTSQYITFIDSDDWISVDYLRVLMDIATEYKADLAMCGMLRTEVFDDCWMTKVSDDESVGYSSDEFMRIMLRLNGNRTVHYAWGKLYKRDILDLNHFPEGILNEDVEGCFKAIVRATNVVETRKALYYYYKNPDSITGSRFGENYLNLKEVWGRVYEIAKRDAPQWCEAVKINVMRSDFTILCDSLIHGDARSDSLYQEELNMHLKTLRRNLPQLMRSPIAINRRLFIAVISVFYRPINRITKRLKGFSGHD